MTATAKLPTFSSSTRSKPAICLAAAPTEAPPDPQRASAAPPCPGEPGLRLLVQPEGWSCKPALRRPREQSTVLNGEHIEVKTRSDAVVGPFRPLATKDHG